MCVLCFGVVVYCCVLGVAVVCCCCCANKIMEIVEDFACEDKTLEIFRDVAFFFIFVHFSIFL